MLTSALALGGLLVGCQRQREQPREREQEARTELDAGALRASAIDGLEAAAKDPVLASELGLAGALEQAQIEEAIERLLARASADPRLSAASDRFFAEVQEGPAMRAALADYARANPELDLAALTEGFVGHVDERLTRPAIAEAIAASLRTELRGADPTLARALIVGADGAEVLAAAIVRSFADAKLRAELERRLGKDPAALQQRLERRLAEPGRLAYLIPDLGEAARTEAGLEFVVEVIDHEATAKLLAGAVSRALEDEQVRARGEALFGLALAEELDGREFERELRRLLDEPAVVREVAGLLDAVAREEFVREGVASLAGVVAAGKGFGEGLLEALD